MLDAAASRPPHHQPLPFFSFLRSIGAVGVFFAGRSQVLRRVWFSESMFFFFLGRTQAFPLFLARDLELFFFLSFSAYGADTGRGSPYGLESSGRCLLGGDGRCGCFFSFPLVMLSPLFPSPGHGRDTVKYRMGAPSAPVFPFFCIPLLCAGVFSFRGFLLEGRSFSNWTRRPYSFLSPAPRSPLSKPFPYFFFSGLIGPELLRSDENRIRHSRIFFLFQGSISPPFRQRSQFSHTQQNHKKNKKRKNSQPKKKTTQKQKKTQNNTKTTTQNQKH